MADDEDDDDLTPYLMKPKASEWLKNMVKECLTEMQVKTAPPTASDQSGNYLERQNQLLLAELLKLKGLTPPSDPGGPESGASPSLISGEKPPTENAGMKANPLSAPKRPFWL